MISSSHLSVFRNLHEPFFKSENAVFNVEQEKIHYLCEGGIDKSVPRDVHEPSKGRAVMVAG